MNKVVLCGRLTKDPDVKYGQDDLCIARYTMAVDRRGKDKGADFISCVVFGKGGEFAEKYLRKGMKVMVIGRIRTGSYTSADGRKVYTTDVVVEEHEFAESKKEAQEVQTAPDTGFMDIPDGLDEELPFA